MPCPGGSCPQPSGGIFNKIAQGAQSVAKGIVGGRKKDLQGIKNMVGAGSDQQQGAEKFSPEELGQLLKIGIFDEDQLSAMKNLLQTSMQGIQGTNLDFAPIAAQAREQFQQKTIPSIAERFTEMGGQSSSVFPQQLGEQAAGLESNLAALESQYNLNKVGALSGLLSTGLTPRYDTVFSPAAPRQPAWWERALGGLGQGLGAGLNLGAFSFYK